MKHHYDRAKRCSIFSRLLLALLAAVAMASLVSGNPGKQAGEEALVREFMAAFNAHDVEAMISLVDENVQWLSINGTKVTVEVEGKEALRASMGRYFRSCPSCKSSLEQIQKAGGRVTATERATWTGKNGAKSQTSLSVYEFNNNKILRVYYFPADKAKEAATNE